MVTNAITTSQFNPIIMREMMAIPPGHTCPTRGNGEQQKSVESRREPGDLVCLGSVSKQASDGTPRAAETLSQNLPSDGGC